MVNQGLVHLFCQLLRWSQHWYECIFDSLTISKLWWPGMKDMSGYIHLLDAVLNLQIWMSEYDINLICVKSRWLSIWLKRNPVGATLTTTAMPLTELVRYSDMKFYQFWPHSYCRISSSRLSSQTHSGAEARARLTARWLSAPTTFCILFNLYSFYINVIQHAYIVWH